MNLARRKAPAQHANQNDSPTLKLHRPGVAPPLKQTEFGLNEGLLRLCASNSPAQQIREEMRKLLLEATLGAGACHLRVSRQGWISETVDLTGNLPQLDLRSKELTDRLDKYRGATAINLEQLPGSNLPVLIGSTVMEADKEELLVLALSESSEMTTSLKCFEKVILGHRLLSEQSRGKQSNEEAETLASLLDLTRMLADAESLAAGCKSVAEAFSDHLGCTVAIGTCFEKGSRPCVQAISGQARYEVSSDLITAYEHVVSESLVRCEQGLFPPQDEQSNHLLLAHRQLALEVGVESVLSSPIRISAGDTVGAIVLVGSGERLRQGKHHKLLDVSAESLGSQLQLLYNGEPGWVRQHVDRLFLKTKPVTRWLAGFVLVSLSIGLFVPVPYRVRTSCQVEPVTRRFAVAPFEGLVADGFVKPGEVVQKNDPLAEMDGRTIRWKLLGVTAQREQALRKGQIKLAQGNPAETIHADLESQKLDAETNVLLHQQDSLIIRSPISGVILEGSLERSKAASVNMGQVLFEVAPLEQVKIEVAIPGDEVANIKDDAAVMVWLEGNEDKPIHAELERIHPRSTIQDGRNVFLAELTLDNHELDFRPGLKGHVRIDGGKHPLWWTLFHKPINFVRSRFTFW